MLIIIIGNLQNVALMLICFTTFFSHLFAHYSSDPYKSHVWFYLAVEVWRSLHLCQHLPSASSPALWNVSPRHSRRPPSWLSCADKKSPSGRPLACLEASKCLQQYWLPRCFGDLLNWVLGGFWGRHWPPGLEEPMKNKDRRHPQDGEVICSDLRWRCCGQQKVIIWLVYSQAQ